MREGRTLVGNLDWLSIGLYLVLILLGWGNIYAAVFNEENASIFDMGQRYGKQLLWILTSLALVVFIMLIDSNVYHSLAYPIYIASMLSLVLVLLFGKEIAGARSWFVLGGFSIQPAEFAKMATALALARFLEAHNVDLTRFRYQLRAFALIFLPALLIIPQPDPGSALVYSALFLVLYREGLSVGYLLVAFALAILFILSLLFPTLYLTISIALIGIIAIYRGRKIRNFYWQVLAIAGLAIGFIQTVDYTFYNVLEDRHRNRINILLGKTYDPQGVGYNTNQSMIAIGSGGLTGKGYLQGTQTKFDFVPEQSTDFIFCTVGEEWGFLGSSLLILLFLLLFLRLIQVAERQKTTFARAYGYALVSILFFHFAINIAMTIGLAPVIGIPLPFFSYGGSSLWGFTVLLFIFLRMDANRVNRL